MIMRAVTIVLFLAGFGAILAEKKHGSKKHGAKKHSGESFCYNDEEGCGPSTSAWPDICREGQRQSPIDLPGQLEFTNATFLRLKNYYKGDFFRMKNNGHSISVDFVGESGQNEGTSSRFFFFPDPVDMHTLRKYKFASVHFHWGVDDTVGSEHTVDGVSTPMEAHFVHYLADYETLAEAVASGNENALSVLGVFIDTKSQVPSSLASIVENLELVQDASHDDGGFVTVNKPLDFTQMLTSGMRHQVYSYKGSLTTPGCNEQVNWYVLKNPGSALVSELEAFRSSVTDSRGFYLQENHRPVLALNGRTISRSYLLVLSPPF